ncbi:MAG TPA: tetratricopeptide repeat protein [Candidatus Eisenbacteria bacterium]|nr:tetratricopeptide repeat protein [Candidatus Eisenbacteria bacterium]
MPTLGARDARIQRFFDYYVRSMFEDPEEQNAQIKLGPDSHQSMRLSSGIRFAIVSVCLIALAFAQNLKDQVAEIGAALQLNEFDHALELLRPALQRFPSSDELWVMQGVAYARKGQKKEALDSFHTAVKISPNNVQALHAVIQAEYNDGDARAIPLLEHLLKLRPEESMSHAMLAVLEYQQGRCREAVIHFEKADSIFDQQIPALHAYATCLVKLRKLDSAAEVLQRALALNPDDKRERQLLACLQVMIKKPEAALVTLRPLFADDHVEAATLELASAAYEDTHDTEKAVSSLQQAILLDPQNVQFYLDFAALSAAHQSFQVGIGVVNDGIELQPKAAALYFARGMLYAQVAEYEKSQADFERAYALDPTQSLTAAAQGLSAVQQNDLDRALSNVQEKLASRPKDPILLYLKADILVQKGAEPSSAEFRTAMRSARSAVALRPTLAPARAVLAKLYLQAGDYSAAVLECRKALEIDPKDQTSLYHLIQALRKSGKTSELPELLKRLALLRQEASKEEREQYRYKLVEGDAPSQN